MAFHRDAWVVDAHTHGLNMLPAVPRAAYRALNRTTMPPDEGFEVFASAAVDAAIVKAVGDGPVTRWYRGTHFDAVVHQLGDLRRQVTGCGGTVVTTAYELAQARTRGGLTAILGLEGADAIGTDVERLDVLHGLGVRVVGVIHLGHNQLGTTSMTWMQYVGPLPRRRLPDAGLTALGRATISRLDTLGMVIDLAHADRATTLDAVELATRPVISSHAGAVSADDRAFARYLSDDELRAIASTGGVIGLWPYNHRGKGVATVDALVDHANYIADLIGPQHLCIGTDMNGVPGLMTGYRGEADLPVITAALLDSGFTEVDTRGILGENIGRVLTAVMA
jgi:membrane dipeptidase